MCCSDSCFWREFIILCPSKNCCRGQCLSVYEPFCSEEASFLFEAAGCFLFKYRLFICFESEASSPSLKQKTPKRCLPPYPSWFINFWMNYSGLASFRFSIRFLCHFGCWRNLQMWLAVFWQPLCGDRTDLCEEVRIFKQISSRNLAQLLMTAMAFIICFWALRMLAFWAILLRTRGHSLCLPACLRDHLRSSWLWILYSYNNNLSI